MKLRILSPEETHEYDVVWIEIETPTGNYVIQAGHIATTLIARPDVPITYCLKSGKQETVYPVKQSIVHVVPDLVTVLLSE